ncbi:MAG: hypothetical protein KJP25_10130 [Gammaproteobacteria bacterium]|nr:hypothetical protein [Gammaproteobacteria bacterium]NNM12614.1 hypothetical protein [Pseudomonadales bacterium]RZV60139.1 MAG: hypothetical protein EX270_00495 [Pseudomonadales bacterium]
MFIPLLKIAFRLAAASKAALCAVLMLCLAIAPAQHALAQAVTGERLAALVVTPEASYPADIIYDKVVRGISSSANLEVTRLTLPKGSELEWLQEQVNSRTHSIVIAVGNQSYQLCAELETDSTVVAGGISGKPNGIPTLSLTGDPRAALSQVKKIAPEVRDIRLVYSVPMNGWWYDQAKQVAQEFGIEIHGYRADDLKQGVKLYEKMVRESTPKQSAIWIPLRSIVPSKTILPFLLEKAWSKKLPVVSNNPSHTKLGSLMALYPEHESMGAQLAEFAIAHHNRLATVERINGTTRLRLAVNLRTGAHIGLRFSAEQRKRFDKIFPAR